MLKICLTGPGYTQQHFDKLAHYGFEVVHSIKYLTTQALQLLLPDIDAYVLGGEECLTEKELAYSKQLKVISFVGTGYTSFIDENSAKKYNISIFNTPAVNAPAVAEHAIGFLIGLQRKLFQYNWEVKNNCVQPNTSNELSSLQIGIVGMGEIGSRIARIIRHGFNSEVIYTSRNRKVALENELKIMHVSMEALFSSADVIILSLPTNEQTRYFINDTLLSHVKEGVKIINIAGAHLIEPVALKKYLNEDKISAIAMDGYYIEPLPSPANDPHELLLFSDDRLIVTPHVAAKTTQSWSRMIDLAINNAIYFFHEPHNE